LQATRAEVGRRAVTPWWFYPIFGLLSGVAMASFSTRSPLVILGAVWAANGGAVALAYAYKRITGMWISGLRRGKTRRATAALILVYGSLLPLVWWLEFHVDVRGAAVVGGLVLAVAMTVIGAWSNRLFRAELTGVR
jgi:hypothetical protein